MQLASHKPTRILCVVTSTYNRNELYNGCNPVRYTVRLCTESSYGKHKFKNMMSDFTAY